MTNNQPKIELTDKQWLKIKPLFPKQVPGRTGTPWRDLDREYGPWKICYSRFRKWTKIGFFEETYQVLATSDFDWENVSIDSTTIKVTSTQLILIVKKEPYHGAQCCRLINQNSRLS